MADPGNGGARDRDWERWRGGVDSRLDTIHEDVLGLSAWRTEHERWANQEVGRMRDYVDDADDTLHSRITRLEVKVAAFAAVGAAAGALAALLIEWWLGRIGG